MVAVLESFMYEVSNLFLVPVLLMIIALFVYSFFQIGIFIMESIQRRKHSSSYQKHCESSSPKKIKGYPIFSYFVANRLDDEDTLELFAYKKLENISIVTRVAPMLGLVATMIPMGPALKALSDGNVQGISENLIIAFAAVIFALIAASITYWIASKRKGWYASEIIDILKRKTT
ncbi:MAG: hypothetical protein HF962_03470 [Sulfurovum sp.]|nr:hypothetical protein [Sulfurovum sp.]